MRLVSKLQNGGDHPASGITIPPAGEVFEVADETAALIPAELAVPEAAASPKKVVAPMPAKPAESKE